MPKRMQDKVCLVTGGGSGIGQATCVRLAEEGAIVFVSDIDGDAAQSTADSITASGGVAQAIQQDVTKVDRWKEVVVQIVQSRDSLDVLVNNAGIVHAANVEEETLDGWRNIQAVYLEAVFLGTQAAIDSMKESGGAIVNISSIEGIVGEPMVAAYNASKGGVRIFTKSAALHCASKRYPIRINSVHPGYVSTPLIENAAATLESSEAALFMEKVLNTIPMQRLAEPREIANAILFVASDEASYITGAELIIDGGYTAH